MGRRSGLGAEFHELVLLDSKNSALRRFTERNRSADPARLDTRAALDHTENAWSTVYDELMALVASRPAAKVVPTRAGRVGQAYRDLMDRLS